jgi:hypothetical protein
LIRIGTRGSLLATTQAGTIRDQLIARGHDAELVIISTAGDLSSAPVAEIGVGVFTAALREAIADGRVDMAVHSYKDLPTAGSSSPQFRGGRTPATPLSRGTGWCWASCRWDRSSGRRRCAGPRSLEHWVSVWKSAP